MVLQPYELNKNDVITAIKDTDPDFDLKKLDDYFNFDKAAIFKPHISSRNWLINCHE
jgi:hypothetical protein